MTFDDYYQSLLKSEISYLCLSANNWTFKCLILFINLIIKIVTLRISLIAAYIEVQDLP